MSTCRTSQGQAKVRYDSRADAKAALRWMQRILPDFDEGNRPYRCRVCSYWHVGRYPADPQARAGLRAAHR
jgi:hypothetical protein